ncbi:MAG: Z1 domain-containing protein [Rhodobacteraceae bacterium]|nr:Z1 domain-containing protein [Paracoccaceae bacterium]
MSNHEEFRKLSRFLVTSASSQLTPNEIRQKLESLRRSYRSVTDEDAEQLALELEETVGIRLRTARALSRPFEPWLDKRKIGIDWHYWNRYRILLEAKGFTRQVLASIDNDTDRVLGYLENPKKNGPWERRGMVMGHVQSGKTGNYIGVVTKAADAGYRVIIVIAGVQNRLRSQTQERLDEAFVGYESGIGIGVTGRRPVGVGKQGMNQTPVTFTTTVNDFSKSAANQINIRLKDLLNPVLFVIKKETNILKNLIDWLITHNAQQLGTNTISEPMLLIDDEADNASINIRYNAEEVSTINRLIRSLLGLFERSAYVGYTATPFANILIDPKEYDQQAGSDLFPRNFIVSLNAPSNYFGAKEVFGDRTARVVQEIDDHHDVLPMSHKIDHDVTNLPKSLLEAVRTFVLAKAIRLVRGQRSVHNSMLVNVSRFVSIQRQVRNEIHAFVDDMTASIRVNGSLPELEALEDPEIAALKHTLEKHYGDVAKGSWDEVRTKLLEAVSSIRVAEINSKSSNSLKYSEYRDYGRTVIAVGGLSLSRGLTLEGLSVSYVLRQSMMYDTLFQMGRWFGYRDHYSDLCRVWITDEARGWYEHIADSIEELRDDLVRMESAGATPQEFGLKVRGHPDWLMVTARNKMGAGVKHRVKIALANRFVETTVLHRNSSAHQTNIQAVKKLVEHLMSCGIGPATGKKVSEGCLVQNVPIETIDRFLMRFRNHPHSPLTQSDQVRMYIKGLKGELDEWDVLFAGVKLETPRTLIYQLPGLRVICQRRVPSRGSNATTVSFAQKRRVASRGVERVGLTKLQRKEVEKEWLEEEAIAGRNVEGTKNFPDRIYRRVRKRPLMIIHLLAIGQQNEDLSGATPVVAWSISFPPTRRNEKAVEYIVNQTWFQDIYPDETDD